MDAPSIVVYDHVDVLWKGLRKTVLWVVEPISKVRTDVSRKTGVGFHIVESEKV